MKRHALSMHIFTISWISTGSLSFKRFLLHIKILNIQCQSTGKLHHVIGAVGWCAVVSQQGEEQGTEHTALWAPCAECDAARDVVADSYCLWPLTEEVLCKGR